jgi:rubrerythrin
MGCNMIDELTNLLDIAMDREIVSQSFYIAGQKKTQDAGAIQLMRELADQELRHYNWIKNFKGKGITFSPRHSEKLADLKVSEYLTEVNISEGVSLQDVITAAMKREQRSAEFYQKMKQILETPEGQELCDRLVHEELHHKQKLELFFDDLIGQED